MNTFPIVELLEEIIFWDIYPDEAYLSCLTLNRNIYEKIKAYIKDNKISLKWKILYVSENSKTLYLPWKKYGVEKTFDESDILLPNHKLNIGMLRIARSINMKTRSNYYIRNEGKITREIGISSNLINCVVKGIKLNENIKTFDDIGTEQLLLNITNYYGSRKISENIFNVLFNKNLVNIMGSHHSIILKDFAIRLKYGEDINICIGNFSEMEKNYSKNPNSSIGIYDNIIPELFRNTEENINIFEHINYTYCYISENTYEFDTFIDEIKVYFKKNVILTKVTPPFNMIKYFSDKGINIISKLKNPENAKKLTSFLTNLIQDILTKCLTIFKNRNIINPILLGDFKRYVNNNTLIINCDSITNVLKIMVVMKVDIYSILNVINRPYELAIIICNEKYRKYFNILYCHIFNIINRLSHINIGDFSECEDLKIISYLYKMKKYNKICFNENTAQFAYPLVINNRKIIFENREAQFKLLGLYNNKFPRKVMEKILSSRIKCRRRF